EGGDEAAEGGRDGVGGAEMGGVVGTASRVVAAERLARPGGLRARDDGDQTHGPERDREQALHLVSPFRDARLFAGSSRGSMSHAPAPPGKRSHHAKR